MLELVLLVVIAVVAATTIAAGQRIPALVPLRVRRAPVRRDPYDDL